MEALVVTICMATYAVLVETIPPSACFANFRWDDCGMKPKPVMYYWKPGSRCEVGIWRGCLPNINMFKDEYECVSTCIFSVRAQLPDWHNLKEDEELTTQFYDFTEEAENVTDSGPEAENMTNVTDDEVTTEGESADSDNSSSPTEGETEAEAGG